MTARVLIALPVALAAVAAPGSTASPQSARASGSADIYTIAIDGTGRRALAQTSDLETTPSVSPDGKRLAFVRSRVEAGEWVQHVMVLELSTRRVRVVGPAHAELHAGGPAWAPRGGRLAFSFFDTSTCTAGSNKCATPEVRVADADSAGYRTVRRHAVDPSWSPDGRRIVAEGEWIVGEPNAIEIFDLRGNLVRRLAGAGVDPAWSADGTVIAYAASTDSGDPRAPLVLVRASGGGVRVVARGSAPVWSPRHRRLLFEHDGWIHRHEVGRGSRRLARGTSPGWSPRGSRVAFFREQRHRTELWVMDANGRNERRITSLGRAYGRPAWSRDGRRLYYAAGPRP